MKQITSYIVEHKVQFACLMLLALATGLGMIDHTTAMAGGIAGGMILDTEPTLKDLMAAQEKAVKSMEENIKKSQDMAMKALEEVRTEGTLHGKTNEKLAEIGKLGNELSDNVKELKTRILEIEQKQVRNPTGGGGNEAKSIGQIVAESETYKAAKGGRSMPAVEVGSFHKTAIVNATGASQPLVAADRRAMVFPALRRLTIRDLLPQNRTSSNLIEFCTENVYTNSAGPQYDASPGGTEGVTKPESGITFTLNSTAVITLAHWIPASRQVLSDAPMLQGYVDGRLRYGMALEEEDELLTGTGAAGTLTGINASATAFNGGATNQTTLDTLLKAFLQISLSNFEASGVIMHPTDWTAVMLLKDTTNRYLFSDPHSTELPRVWGKDVVSTASQTQGTFTAGAFTLAAEIYDREDASVRIAEQHANFFVQNMVAILAEERLALAILRPTAIVTGNVSYAG